MRIFFIKIIKVLFVLFNLKLRTIVYRLPGIAKLIDSFRIVWYKNLVITPKKLVFTHDFDRIPLQRLEVYFDFPKVRILNTNFTLEHLIRNDHLNKDDYLHLYTFFYLNWENLDANLTCDNRRLMKVIFGSEISNEPFVISQQAWNLILRSKELHLYDDILVKHFGKLKKSIEFHVDGNHVLENYISLVLLELYFYKQTFYIKYLYREIERQTFKGWHVEKNLKYIFDIITKILVLLSVKNVDSEQFVMYRSKISKVINVWIKNAVLVGNNFPLVHDNIDGDEIRHKLNFFSRFMNLKNNKIHQVIDLRPVKGFRGHAFDVNYLPAFGQSVFSFGTLKYSNSHSRIYQRKRVNNVQPCLSKSDSSMLFWKSFRVLVSLPSKLSYVDDSFVINEFVFSKNKLKRLNYKYKFSENAIIFTSNKSIILRFWTDIVLFAGNHYVKTPFFELHAQDGIVTTTLDKRAFGIDLIKDSIRIEFIGSHFVFVRLT